MNDLHSSPSRFFVKVMTLVVGGASAAFAVTTVSTEAAAARPERAPPVEAVARALGVELSAPPSLDEDGRRVAKAAGQRLVSLCPDCRLSTIDEESPCGWARAQRIVIRNAVAAGMDEERIVDTYVRTYGTAVLAIDKSQGFAAASWVVPILASIISLVFVVWVGGRLTAARAGEARTRTSNGVAASPPADAYKVLRAELEALE